MTFLGIFIYSGCNRKITDAFNPEKAIATYDQAKYDWYFAEGTKQKLLGNTEEAIKYLNQCILINPESDASYYELAQIMINNGDLQGGKKYIKKAAEIDPDNLWYMITLAGVYYQSGNIDSTIICYEKAIKLEPERESLQISLANLYNEEKRYDKAREILEKFDKKYGINENTTISLVRTLIAEKKYREGRNKIEELIAQYPENVTYKGMLAEVYRYEGNNKQAEEIYRNLINVNPDNPIVQLSLCNFLIAEKDYDELMNILDTVIVNGKISKDDKVTLLAGLFDITEVVEKYGPKLESLVSLVEGEYKDDNLVSLLMPELLEKENRLGEAAKKLEEIVTMHPENYLAWEKLLLVYYNLKDYRNLQLRGAECTGMYKKAFMPKILYAAGAMENKNYDLALSILEEADLLTGENNDMKLQILTMRADTYYRMKDYSKAFTTFDEALRNNAKDLTVLNNYAYYLAEQNMKLKEAEEMSKMTIQTEKNNTTFLDTYAWVLYKQGKAKEAAKIMERIIDSGEKEDAEWFEHYGFILKKLGRCKDAVTSWEKALSIDKSKINLEKEIANCKK